MGVSRGMQILCAGISKSGWNCGQWEKNNSVNLPSWIYHVFSCRQSKALNLLPQRNAHFQQKELLLYAVRWWWDRRDLPKVWQDQRHLWSLVTWFVFLQLNWVTWMGKFQFEPFLKLGDCQNVKVSKAVACGWISDLAKDKIFVSYFGNFLSEKDKNGGYSADVWAEILQRLWTRIVISDGSFEAWCTKQISLGIGQAGRPAHILWAFVFFPSGTSVPGFVRELSGKISITTQPTLAPSWISQSSHHHILFTDRQKQLFFWMDGIYANLHLHGYHFCAVYVANFNTSNGFR